MGRRCSYRYSQQHHQHDGGEQIQGNKTRFQMERRTEPFGHFQHTTIAQRQNTPGHKYVYNLFAPRERVTCRLRVFDRP